MKGVCVCVCVYELLDAWLAMSLIRLRDSSLHQEPSKYFGANGQHSVGNVGKICFWLYRPLSSFGKMTS